MTESETSAQPNPLLTRVRRVGFAEALSFLALLGVGMPLKYMFGVPLAVRVLGPIHGALFLWLGYDVAMLVLGHGWGFAKGAKVMIASLLPGGPLFIDSWLKSESEEFHLD